MLVIFVRNLLSLWTWSVTAVSCTFHFLSLLVLHVLPSVCSLFGIKIMTYQSAWYVTNAVATSQRCNCATVKAYVAVRTACRSVAFEPEMHRPLLRRLAVYLIRKACQKMAAALVFALSLPLSCGRGCFAWFSLQAYCLFCWFFFRTNRFLLTLISNHFIWIAAHRGMLWLLADTLFTKQ